MTISFISELFKINELINELFAPVLEVVQLSSVVQFIVCYNTH